jgi:hypothetical protein
MLPPSSNTTTGLYHPPLTLPLLPLPLGHHGCHRHHGGQTHNCPLPKKEATAAPPLAYQWQHRLENVYKSRQLGLIYLSTVFEVCDVSQGNSAISKLLAWKNYTFFAIYILLDESP